MLSRERRHLPLQEYASKCFTLMRLGKSFAVLLSQEGARMGDKFGSFVYCLTVHPAYVEIMERCPNVLVQAATDDLKGYARDPLDLCQMFPIAAEALERHAGVRLNVEKSAILLPRGVPDPDVDRLPAGSVVQDGHVLMRVGGEHGHLHKIELKRDGTIIVGAAVGMDDFIMQHVMSVVRQAIAKFSALRLVNTGLDVVSRKSLALCVRTCTVLVGGPVGLKRSPHS